MKYPMIYKKYKIINFQALGLMARFFKPLTLYKTNSLLLKLLSTDVPNIMTELQMKYFFNIIQKNKVKIKY